MKNNIEILKEWNNSISCYKKLTFCEAQELYKKSLDSIDKKDYLDELIIGTLYVVPDFISKNGLLYLNSSSYDMNDIISICNEIWINKINSGKLLKVNSFREVFDNDFYNKLCDGLGVPKYSTDYSIFNISLFVNLFDDYLVFKEKNCDANCVEFIEYIKTTETIENILIYIKYYKREICNMCKIFDGIIDSLESEELDIKLTKTKINKLKYILISNGLEYLRSDINEITANNLIDDFLDEYYRSQILEKLMHSNLSDSNKDVIIKRFGLFGNKCYTLEEVAKSQGVSRERIRQKEARALRKLRFSKQFEEYR